MTLTDPRLIGLTPEIRRAQKEARTERRVAVLERTAGGSSGISSGGGIIGTTTDPNALHKTLVDARGDLLVATADNTVVRLPAPVLDGSTDGYVLTIDSSTPSGLAWSATATVALPTYNITNLTPDQTYDADATTIDQLADVLGTLILDLPLPVSGYVPANAVADRTFDANNTTVDELADVIGSLCADLMGTPSAYTVSNVTVTRSMDCDNLTLDRLADVIGTFIEDLTSVGILP